MAAIVPMGAAAVVAVVAPAVAAKANRSRRQARSSPHGQARRQARVESCALASFVLKNQAILKRAVAWGENS